MFFVFEILHFWRENDVTNCVPKFGFANMGYLMVPFERTCLKDLKTEKKSEISLSTQKISGLEMQIFRHFVTKNSKNSHFKTSYLLIGWTYFKTFFSFEILGTSSFKCYH